MVMVPYLYMEPVSPSPTQTPDEQTTGRHESAPGLPIRKLFLAGVLLVPFVSGIAFWTSAVQQPAEDTRQTGTTNARSPATPDLKVEAVLSGREHIWDIAFLPTKEMIITERKGIVSLIKNGQAQTLVDINDVYARGEGGLLGLAIDPQFATNRYVYTCFNSTNNDIRVARWKLTSKADALTGRTDIVTGIPQNESGRHSGCRLVFGPDGYLWIGTGDTAQNLTPQSPQDPKSLGGKILRVDRNGKGAPSNLGGKFDARIYSYGHRNTQGLAFFASEVRGVPGISAEHGPGIDDEINPLKPGNFGWAPPDGPYDESVPMTNKERFPDAVEAIWSSGNPTLAPSGAAILRGGQWKGWDGAVVVAMLKGQHLRILLLDDNLTVTGEAERLTDKYGRLRAVTPGPNGALYVSTSNGSDDKVLRILPN
jgi:aldose sugar dehydrogenase